MKKRIEVNIVPVIFVTAFTTIAIAIFIPMVFGYNIHYLTIRNYDYIAIGTFAQIFGVLFSATLSGLLIWITAKNSANQIKVDMLNQRRDVVKQIYLMDNYAQRISILCATDSYRSRKQVIQEIYEFHKSRELVDDFIIHTANYLFPEKTSKLIYELYETYLLLEKHTLKLKDLDEEYQGTAKILTRRLYENTFATTIERANSVQYLKKNLYDIFIQDMTV